MAGKCKTCSLTPFSIVGLMFDQEEEKSAEKSNNLSESEEEDVLPKSTAGNKVGLKKSGKGQNASGGSHWIKRKRGRPSKQNEQMVQQQQEPASEEDKGSSLFEGEDKSSEPLEEESLDESSAQEGKTRKESSGEAEDEDDEGDGDNEDEDEEDELSEGEDEAMMEDDAEGGYDVRSYGRFFIRGRCGSSSRTWTALGACLEGDAKEEI